MANYDIRTLQLHILEILKAVDKVCREHHLRYYVWAGTMLGAIRHKGFIPWDDDMDIAMPRKDYDILMAHAKEWLPESLEAVCAETDAKYPGAFGKIINRNTTLIEREAYAYLGGIYIDVFPLDGQPSNSIARKFINFRYKYYCRLVYLIHRDPFKHGKRLDSYLLLMLRKIYSHKCLQDKLRRIMTSYDFDACSLVIDYDDGVNGAMPKSVLGTPVPYRFEDTEVLGVEHFDEYLTNKYGDYMTIPPHDEQRQHNFFYLDYNLPYREYKDQRRFML